MDLLTWAKENGSEIGAVSIESSTESGLLLRANADIQANSNIVSCSYKTMLSYLNIGPSTNTNASFPAEFIQALEIDDPNILGHFFLIQQYLLGTKSFWYPYIQLLPQPNQPEKLGVPILWSYEDQKFLAGTNAEPPIKQRAKMWEDDWQKATQLLANHQEREKYTYDLYQWAASIFGSRSFRASLTVPEDMIRNSKSLSVEEQTRVLEHIRLDRFSVLLPLLDLGNHNGINAVDWTQNPIQNTFTLSNRSLILQGSEVYNYYGAKSNSELLVGYGFTLPGPQHDIVNLKVTPGPDALALRRSQACHCSPAPGQMDTEFMFQVRSPSSQPTNSPLPELQPFSHGLIDTMACMVATPREKAYLSLHTNTCFESSITSSLALLPRNLIQVLYILSAKLESEIARLDSHGSSLRTLQNRNQTLALDYRTRQRQTLTEALTPISALLATLSTQLNSQPSHTPIILTLPHAYAYLTTAYPVFGTAITQLIASDQEEALPLDWTVLLEDWDHTYWVVWVFVLLLLRGRDEGALKSMNEGLDTWLGEMPMTEKTTQTLFAEPSEEETIDSTIEGTLSLNLPELLQIGSPSTPSSYHALRNHASAIVYEAGIRGSYDSVPQEVLCISFGTPCPAD